MSHTPTRCGRRRRCSHAISSMRVASSWSNSRSAATCVGSAPSGARWPTAGWHRPAIYPACSPSNATRRPCASTSHNAHGAAASRNSLRCYARRAWQPGCPTWGSAAARCATDTRHTRSARRARSPTAPHARRRQAHTRRKCATSSRSARRTAPASRVARRRAPFCCRTLEPPRAAHLGAPAATTHLPSPPPTHHRARHRAPIK